MLIIIINSVRRPEQDSLIATENEAYWVGSLQEQHILCVLQLFLRE